MVFFIDLSHIALVIISLVPWSLLDTENNTINPAILTYSYNMVILIVDGGDAKGWALRSAG